MGLSFDDEESFKETLESLRFNDPPSDQNASQKMGSSSSMPLQDSERNGDNIYPSDSNIPWLRRVESSSSIIKEILRSRDIQVCYNNPHASNDPEFTSANAM